MLKNKLVIIGDSAFAEIAYKYFKRENKYEIVGFAVEKNFLKKEQLFGLPLIEFEKINEAFPPSNHFTFVAITYSKLNRIRTRLFKELKIKGYSCANYISPYSYVDEEIELGENIFIFESNTIQPFVKIKDNCIIWSGNHLGHHSLINENVFISSHVVISGFCEIGCNSFLGVNTTIANGLKIGKDNFISEGSIISKNTEDDSIYRSKEAQKSKVSASRFFKIK